VYVSGAGGDRLIALRSVVVSGASGFTGKHRNGTGRPRKGRKLIGRQKTVVVTGGADGMK
jgi:hypothetical protein